MCERLENILFVIMEITAIILALFIWVTVGYLIYLIFSGGLYVS